MCHTPVNLSFLEVSNLSNCYTMVYVRRLSTTSDVAVVLRNFSSSGYPARPRHPDVLICRYPEDQY